VRTGATVQRRSYPAGKQLYRGVDVQDETVVVTNYAGTGETPSCSINELLVVQKLEEPIYPALTSVGRVERRGAERLPSHGRSRDPPDDATAALCSPSADEECYGAMLLFSRKMFSGS
jgi:hypothetical protein